MKHYKNLVVGSGPAGLAVSHSLLCHGEAVTLVEASLDSNNPFPNSFQGFSDKLSLTSGLSRSRSRSLGGTSNLWGGGCCELDEEDFQVRSWIPNSGWPFSKSELHPHYENVYRLLGISPQTNHNPVSIGHSPLPGLELVVLQYTPQKILKNLVSKFKSSYSRSFTLLTGLTLVDICLNQDLTRVVSASFLNDRKQPITILCENLVLCLGGIESTRILLNAFEKKAIKCGDGHTNLGRYFCEHPIAPLATVRPFDSDSFLRYEVQSNYALPKRDNIVSTPYYRLPFNLQAENQLLNTVVQFTFSESPITKELYSFSHLRNWWLNKYEFSPTVGDFYRSIKSLPSLLKLVAQRQRLQRFSPSSNTNLPRIALRYQIEQPPLWTNRLYLSKSIDEYGLKRIVLDWSIGDQEKETVFFTYNYVSQLLSKNKIASVFLDTQVSTCFSTLQADLRGGVHHCGTTRMSFNPIDGVVNQNLQVHGIGGIYVCSSSVFPTNGWVNPTFTIMALGDRLGSYLSSR